MRVKLRTYTAISDSYRENRETIGKTGVYYAFRFFPSSVATTSSGLKVNELLVSSLARMSSANSHGCSFVFLAGAAPEPAAAGAKPSFLSFSRCRWSCCFWISCFFS
jgi:hypothetical protein